MTTDPTTDPDESQLHQKHEQSLCSIYGGEHESYKCMDCGATYTWDGTMASSPHLADDGPAVDDEQAAVGEFVE